MKLPALLLTAGLLAVVVPAVPAAAQRGTRVVNIFGNQKCPTSGGEEIVVCRRLDAREQFRIPQELRDDTAEPGPDDWRNTALSLMNVGRTGTGSCTASGPGGSTGCMMQEFRAARAENKQSAYDSVNSALPQ